MTAAVAVPEGLADVPPGPRLATLLAGIDHARVPNNQLLPVLCAQSRQASHEAARLLGVIAEIGRANPTFDDDAIDLLDHPYLHAADEVRAALAWSRRAADRETDLAEQVVHALPPVYAAYLAGTIDRPKVRVFADHLAGLTPEQIDRVCALLVPIAHRLTPGQLVHRLRRMIAAIDPRHYERRYRKALRDRHVTAYLDDTGTAVLTARGLSPGQAAAALERIDTLAHAARRTGHPSTLDQIRVDILAGLLDGTLHHLSRDQIITHLIAHRAADDDHNADQQPGRQAADAAPTAGGNADVAGEYPSRPGAARATAPDTTGTGTGTVDTRTADITDITDSTGADGVGGRGGDTADGSAPASIGATASEHPGGVAAEHRVGVEIRVGLSTLLGHDEHPGEIPGLGPVPAAHAREVVAGQRRAEWRFAVTDDQGRLLCDGVTRRRPDGLSPAGPPGGIVELELPAAQLARLLGTPGRSGGSWAGVLADIAAEYAGRDARDLDAHPHDRLPRAGLRRHVQIRDRTCIGPGCRHRPMRCDQDHTLDHRHGGPTVAADLAPVCRHDHRLKHQGGWTLHQPRPGEFVWTSPLGGRYPVRPEPIAPPLPAPVPRPDDPALDEPAGPAPDELVLWKPTPPPPPPPQPEPADLDEPPPF